MRFEMLAVKTTEVMCYSNIPGMEKVFPMKAQRQRTKRKAVPASRRPLPKDFICIAPEEAKHVFDWLNGSIHEHEKKIAKLHFQLCLHCQEAVAQLRSFKAAVSKDAKELVHRSGNCFCAP